MLPAVWSEDEKYSHFPWCRTLISSIQVLSASWNEDQKVQSLPLMPDTDLFDPSVASILEWGSEGTVTSPYVRHWLLRSKCYQHSGVRIWRYSHLSWCWTLITSIQVLPAFWNEDQKVQSLPTDPFDPSDVL